MSVRNGLGSLLLSGLLCFSMSACSSAPAEDSAVSGNQSAQEETAEKVRVLAPQGAPALAVAGAENSDQAAVEYVAGQDVLVSELAKSDSEYDLIAAPINLGVKSWSEAENFELAGVLTWGNLYIVSSDETWNEEGKTLAAFGEGAVPGMVFVQLYPETNCEVVYYPSVAEASQALQAGKADAALLAQPAAFGAISSSKDSETPLAIQEDLQTLWQTEHETDEKGYPQAALFVKKGAEEEARPVIEEIQAFLESADDNTVEAAVKKAGAENLGIPSEQAAIKTWPQQNIHYKDAVEAKGDIETFLAIFNMSLPTDMIYTAE